MHFWPPYLHVTQSLARVVRCSEDGLNNVCACAKCHDNNPNFRRQRDPQFVFAFENTIEKRGEKMYFIFGQNVNIFSFSVVNNNWDAYKLTKQFAGREMMWITRILKHIGSANFGSAGAFFCVQQPCFASVREIMFCAASSAKWEMEKVPLEVSIRPSILNFKNFKSKRTHLFVSAFISLLKWIFQHAAVRRENFHLYRQDDKTR